MPQGLRNGEDAPLPPRRNVAYPPEKDMNVKESDREYQDVVAADLFDMAGGRELVNAAESLHRALLKQSEQLEKFYSTPFTKRSTRALLTTMESIERCEVQLERWHRLIYPNQKRTKGER